MDLQKVVEELFEYAETRQTQLQLHCEPHTDTYRDINSIGLDVPNKRAKYELLRFSTTTHQHHHMIIIHRDDKHVIVWHNGETLGNFKPEYLADVEYYLGVILTTVREQFRQKAVVELLACNVLTTGTRLYNARPKKGDQP